MTTCPCAGFAERRPRPRSRHRAAASPPASDTASDYPISFAIVNAAPAAMPPTSAVCQALRTGFFTV
jgi:hypothetical protein